MKNSAIAILSVASLVVGAGIGYLSTRNSGPDPRYIPTEVREISPDYKFIDPLIGVETDQSLYPEYSALDAQMNAYIAQAKADGTANSISIYFRDEKSGHWTGVNENETYEPSSMLKVAVMIAYLRASSNQASMQNTTTQDILAKKLYYPGTDISGLHYPPSHILPPGYYSAQDLINAMIIDSDNSAATTLLDSVQDEFQNVYDDFRLPPTPGAQVGDYMTAKSYSLIFRSLYNAAYLSRRLSDQSLELLAQSDFTKGLVAGVPAGTVVAHKFGEHTYALADGTPISHELHDCGIVYYPSKPYLLCVMTKGSDFSNLEKVISGISNLVYTSVDSSQAKTAGK